MAQPAPHAPTICRLPRPLKSRVLRSPQTLECSHRLPRCQTAMLSNDRTAPPPGATKIAGLQTKKASPAHPVYLSTFMTHKWSRADLHDAHTLRHLRLAYAHKYLVDPDSLEFHGPSKTPRLACDWSGPRPRPVAAPCRPLAPPLPRRPPHPPSWISLLIPS